MKKDFIVNVNNKTIGVSEQGFGLILVFDTENKIPYTELGSTSDLLDVGDITSEDKIYKLVSKIFSANPSPVSVAVAGMGAEGVVTDSLDELINEQKSDWFGLVSTDNEAQTVSNLADWASANDRWYFVTTQELSTIESIESSNAAVGFHDNEEDFIAEGLLANMLVGDVGSKTGKFEAVQGSLPADIKLAELNALHKENGFSYIRSKGINYISEGKMSDGTYMDIALGSHFIKARLEEALFLLAVNNGKIPYSDRGISMLIAEVETVLKIATRQGIILEVDGKGVYDIKALRRSEVSSNDIANRKYNGISVKATVAGAIHSAEINIDLVLSEEE